MWHTHIHKLLRFTHISILRFRVIFLLLFKFALGGIIEIELKSIIHSGFFILVVTLGEKIILFVFIAVKLLRLVSK